MTFVSKNIFEYYENNEHNKYYLLKNFTHSNYFGPFKPFEDNPFAFNNNDNYVKTVDDHNDYNINEFGLRGNIYNDSEIIGAGCSFTFGVGIPENARWTDILGQKLNTKITNLGLPGYSVEAICNFIISYAVNNKMPKKIFCFFPDLFRSLLIEDFDFYFSKKWRRPKVENYRLNLTSVNPSIYFNYSEKAAFLEIEDQNKKYIENVFSPHQLIINSVNAISLLELFCLSNNIDLVWTTWDSASAYIIDMLLKVPNFKLKKYRKFVNEQYCNYLDVNAAFMDQLCDLNHNSNFINNYCWSKGSDYVIINNKEKPNWSAHPGIHFQYHVADLFEKVYQ